MDKGTKKSVKEIWKKYEYNTYRNTHSFSQRNRLFFHSIFLTASENRGLAMTSILVLEILALVLILGLVAGMDDLRWKSDLPPR